MNQDVGLIFYETAMLVDAIQNSQHIEGPRNHDGNISFYCGGIDWDEEYAGSILREDVLIVIDMRCIPGLHKFTNDVEAIQWLRTKRREIDSLDDEKVVVND